MSKFLKVKKYFLSGDWNIERVKKAVEKNWITKEEFYTITGVKYDI